MKVKLLVTFSVIVHIVDDIKDEQFEKCHAQNILKQSLELMLSELVYKIMDICPQFEMIWLKLFLYWLKKKWL